MTKATNLEKQATAATTRYAALKALEPGRRAHRLVPAADESLFRQPADRQNHRPPRGQRPFKEADLAGWMRYNWLLDLPQTDFATLGKAIAELENTEPLLSIHHLNIHASAG